MPEQGSAVGRNRCSVGKLRFYSFLLSAKRNESDSGLKYKYPLSSMYKALFPETGASFLSVESLSPDLHAREVGAISFPEEKFPDDS